MVEDKEDKVEVENRKDGEMEIKQLDLNELIENILTFEIRWTLLILQYVGHTRVRLDTICMYF